VIIATAKRKPHMVTALPQRGFGSAGKVDAETRTRRASRRIPVKLESYAIKAMRVVINSTALTLNMEGTAGMNTGEACVKTSDCQGRGHRDDERE